MAAATKREIDALIRHVNTSTREANAALDSALVFVAESNQRIAAMEATTSQRRLLIFPYRAL